jgi:hypothetical protein
MPAQARLHPFRGKAAISLPQCAAVHRSVSKDGQADVTSRGGFAAESTLALASAGVRAPAGMVASSEAVEPAPAEIVF